jgi:hypothetical protein
MALIRQGRNNFSGNPGVFTGNQSFQSGNFFKGGLRNRNVGGFDQRFSGYGNGALDPSSFILPQKSGSISSYTRSNSSLTSAALLIPALPMQVNGSFSLTVTNAQLDQVVQLIASGVLALTGSANLAAAVALEAASVFNLSGSALLGGVIPIQGAGVMSLSTNVTLDADAFMTASAGGPTPLSPEGLAASLLDENDIESGYSLRESVRLILSALVGKLSGADSTTVTIRDINDTVNRIVATVDANGNRTTVTKDVN